MACSGQGQWRQRDARRPGAYISRHDVLGPGKAATPPVACDAVAIAGERRVSADSGAILVDATEAINGEGPQWDEQRKRLYWVDMRAPSLRAFEPGSGRALSWEMPAGSAASACCVTDAWSSRCARVSALFDPQDGSLRSLADAPYDQRRFCFNDGGCDRAGHFLVGPMYHPLAPASCGRDAPQEAPPWRVREREGIGGDTGIELVPLALPAVRISNGLAFSPDGRTLYHADTAKKTIWACDYDPVERRGRAPPGVRSRRRRRRLRRPRRRRRRPRRLLPLRGVRRRLPASLRSGRQARASPAASGPLSDHARVRRRGPGDALRHVGVVPASRRQDRQKPCRGRPVRPARTRSRPGDQLHELHKEPSHGPDRR